VAHRYLRFFWKRKKERPAKGGRERRLTLISIWIASIALVVVSVDVYYSRFYSRDGLELTRLVCGPDVDYQVSLYNNGTAPVSVMGIWPVAWAKGGHRTFNPSHLDAGPAWIPLSITDEQVMSARASLPMVIGPGETKIMAAPQARNVLEVAKDPRYGGPIAGGYLITHFGIRVEMVLRNGGSAWTSMPLLEHIVNFGMDPAGGLWATSCSGPNFQLINPTEYTFSFPPVTLFEIPRQHP